MSYSEDSMIVSPIGVYQFYHEYTNNPVYPMVVPQIVTDNSGERLNLARVYLLIILSVDESTRSTEQWDRLCTVIYRTVRPDVRLPGEALLVYPLREEDQSVVISAPDYEDYTPVGRKIGCINRWIISLRITLDNLCLPNPPISPILVQAIMRIDNPSDVLTEVLESATDPTLSVMKLC